tara:strand:+ start:577 stop:1167 length:591 start_codon:yes stop_codon:yes gene_type:complete
MAQIANYTVDNDTGANVRADINNIFAAIQSLNSGSSDPSGTQVAFQLSVNTTSNLLKLRNASNNGYITVGNVTQTNLGLAALAGSTFTGAVVHNYTSALKIPVGTTAQRPGSPATGELRFNSTLGSAEIYNGSAFAAVGGGAGATGSGGDEVFFESDTNVTTSYTLTSGKNAHTVSPIINSGVTVTVPSGAILVIL